MENGDKLYRERKVKTENYTCSDTVEGEIGRKPCLDTGLLGESLEANRKRNHLLLLQDNRVRLVPLLILSFNQNWLFLLKLRTF